MATFDPGALRIPAFFTYSHGFVSLIASNGYKMIALIHD